MHSISASSLLVIALAVTPAFSSTAQAQDPAAGALGVQLLPPSERLFFDEPGDGRVWARASTYKMSFGPEGATYVPFFGSSAPRNFPIKFGSSSVTIGGESIALASAAAVQRAGESVQLLRGACVESYALSARAMEQTFTFASLPTRAEMRLRIDVQSELGCEPSLTGGLRFGNELGYVEYGRATALDARGNAQALEMTYVDGKIEIVVPAEFCANAVLPLVIDPVVTTFAVDNSSATTRKPDVVFDEGTGRFLVVYEVVTSASDIDIFLRSFTTTGTAVIGGELFVEATTDDWSNPSIATNPGSGTCLIAASGPFVNGQRQLVARTLTPSIGVLGNIVVVASNPFFGSSTFKPQVGGDPLVGEGPRLFCVAYTSGSLSANQIGVLARCVTESGTLVGTGPIVLDFADEQLNQHVAISPTNDGVSWIIVWEREVSPTDGDIYGARIRFDGSVAANRYPIEALNGANYRNPAVSSRLDGSNRYVMVCERVYSNGTADISASMMNNSTKEDGTTINFFDGGPDGSDSPRNSDPEVSTDGRHFAITYVEEARIGSTNTNVYITDWMQTDTELRLVEERVSLATSTTPEAHPAIFSQHAGGNAAGRRHMVVWDDDGENIEGALFDSGVGGAWFPYCFGDGTGTACPCGNTGFTGRGCGHSLNASGARLRVLGTVSTTSDTAQLQGQFMPPNAACLYFQGTDDVTSPTPPFLPGAVFGDGLRCVGGTTLRIASMTNSATGTSTFPPTGSPLDLHVVGLVPAAGSRRHYQGWYRNSASFCTSSVFNLTNGVAIDWGP